MSTADDDHLSRPDSGRRGGWHGPSKAVADERERCAKIAEELGRHYGESAVGAAIAIAIRTVTN